MCIPQMSHKSYSVNRSRGTPGAKQETREDPPGELWSRAWVLALPLPNTLGMPRKQGTSRNRSWKAERKITAGFMGLRAQRCLPR